MYTFEKKNEKFYYRLFISQWPIFFDFNIDVMPKNQYIGKITEIIQGLWLAIEDKQIANEFRHLEKGIKMIAEQIIKKSTHGNNTLLVFRDFGINICDFQPESLIDAILKWAEMELGVEIPETEVKFNRELNKYEFYYKTK